MQGCLTLLAFLVVLGVVSSTISDCSNAKEAEQQARVEAQQRVQQEAARQKLQEDFQSNRDDILAGIRAAIDAGEFASAEQKARRYRTAAPDDAELKELLNAAREQKLYQEVRAVPATDFDRNISLYQQLVALAPDNPTYKERVNHYTQLKQQARQNAVRNLRRSRDDLEKVTWYRSPSAPGCVNCGTGLYAYFGQRDGGKPWLRFVLQYNAEDWLFVDRATVYVDEQPFSVAGVFERDNSSKIWEWMDRNPTPGDVNLLRAISNAKSVTIRFHGRQYQRDVKMPAKQVAAVRQVMTAFDALSAD